MKNLGSCRGISFIEVMVSLFILATSLGAVFSLMTSHQKIYREYNRRLEMLSNARLAAEMITREVADAGYSPLQPHPFDATGGSQFQLLHSSFAFPDVNNTQTRFQILADMNSDAAIAGPSELIEFEYVSSSQQLLRRTDSDSDGDIDSNDDSAEPIAENIVTFTADYRPAFATLTSSVNTGDVTLPLSTVEGFSLAEPFWITDGTNTEIYPGLASIDAGGSSITISSTAGLINGYAAGSIVANVQSVVISVTAESDMKMWAGDGADTTLRLSLQSQLRNYIQ